MIDMMRVSEPDRLIATLVVLSFLLVLAACDGDDPSTKSVKSGIVDTPTLIPTTTPAPSPTPKLLYNIDKAKENFASARQLWVDKGSDSYIVEYRAWCLCPESNRPLKVTARNGIIESINDARSGEELNVDGAVYTNRIIYANRTISELFRTIEDALRWPAWSLNVSYHPELGYPTEFAVSYSDNPDDGFTLDIYSYEPLDPSVPTNSPY